MGGRGLHFAGRGGLKPAEMVVLARGKKTSKTTTGEQMGAEEGLCFFFVAGSYYFCSGPRGPGAQPGLDFLPGQGSGPGKFFFQPKVVGGLPRCSPDPMGPNFFRGPPTQRKEKTPVFCQAQKDFRRGPNFLGLGKSEGVPNLMREP